MVTLSTATASPAHANYTPGMNKSMTTPLSEELREKIASQVEPIILRRLHKGRLDGYTLETSCEIAEAVLSLLPVGWVGESEVSQSQPSEAGPHSPARTSTGEPSAAENWRRKARWNGVGERIWLADFTREDEAETDITVAYTYTPGREAQLYGPPENCWPAEPAEVEIQAAFTDAGEVELTDAERERFELWLIENPTEEAYPEDYDR